MGMRYWPVVTIPAALYTSDREVVLGVCDSCGAVVVTSDVLSVRRHEQFHVKVWRPE